MTIPTQMNCSHSGEGWCLKCVEELHADSEKYRLALESLTVGGSEFYRNPELCVKHVKDRMSARFELLKKIKELNASLKEKDLELGCFNQKLRDLSGAGQGEIDSSIADCLEIGLSHNLFAILKPQIEHAIELISDFHCRGLVQSAFDVHDLISDLKSSLELMKQRLEVSKNNPNITTNYCGQCNDSGRYLENGSIWVHCPCKDNDPHNYREDDE